MPGDPVGAVFWLAFGYCLASRLAEVVLSKRNTSRALESGAVQAADDGTAGLVAVHVAWFVGLLLEGTLVGTRPMGPGVTSVLWGLAAAAEALRVACIVTLGPRWTMGVVAWPGRPLIRTGPYRWLRHPNYLTAGVVLAALPIALGLPLVSILTVPFKIHAVRARIAREDAFLAQPR